MSKIIGIDLGTTNTVTSVFNGEEPVIICPSPNHRAVPSIVALDDSGQWLVGEAARNQQVTNPNDTVYSVKRFMGRRHNEVASEEKLVPYEVSGKADDFVRVAIGKHRMTPQELSARILQNVKAMAEGQLDEEITGAVITVPAYFNDAQRQATRDAGKIAGINVERIINEPTAAAVAYGLEKQGKRCIVVFDLGGGTFDLSAMKIDHGSFKVLAVHGNTHLGGDDFDQRILDVVAEDFLRKERIDIRKDPMALQRLKQAAQLAKATLSDQYEAKIMLPFICVDETGPKHLDYKLTRKRFEAICADLFDNVRACCRTLMDEAKITPKDVDEVVLVGGSTRIPKVQQVAKEVFSTKQLNKTINPDEVVAIGAAIIGGIMQGDLKNVELMDVTSHGFGVEIAGGKTEFLLTKNTPIPTEVKKVFSTPSNNQTAVPINVLEGESVTANENRALGTFRLTGIRKAPRGVPQIEVAFKIDANGILEVTAMDKDTGKSQNITVTGGCGLDDDEIEKMQAPAQKAENDAAKHAERVALKNQAETAHANMIKWVEYNAGAISPKGRGQISAGLEKLRKKIDKNDESGMRVAMKKLDDLRTSYRKAG